MTIFRCDRCGHEQTVRLKVVSLPRAYGDGEQYDRDICDKCVKELAEWILPTKKE
jgi:hypothetical protein